VVEIKLAEPVVTADELTRHFGAFTAVDHLSFDVNAGEVFGFLGPNGAGKSTTIRMLCGILAPSTGAASVAGVDVRENPEGVKASLGYMSQRFSLYHDLTVVENLRFFAGVYGVSRQRIARIVDNAVDCADLSEYRDKLAGDLPLGHRQRLALAAALLHDPPVLFLDEPTSGVDPTVRRTFWDIIRALADAGTTVFVTTHAMDEAEYCDRIAFITAGRLAALGSPGELRARLTAPVALLKTSEALAVVDAVRDITGVEETLLFGAGVRLTLTDASAVQAVTEALNRAGLEYDEPTFVVPTMEDVFVKLAQTDT
jgi:ABC-2 type transport system ATP-binding protein